MNIFAANNSSILGDYPDFNCHLPRRRPPVLACRRLLRGRPLRRRGGGLAGGGRRRRLVPTCGTGGSGGGRRRTRRQTLDGLFSAGWLDTGLNLQKLKVPEISSGPRQEKRNNPQTRLAGLGAGRVP